MISESSTGMSTLKENRHKRLQRALRLTNGKIVKSADTIELLETVIEPYDRVCIEGNNQKHADYLAHCLTQVAVERIHDLHIVQSNIALSNHLDVFEKGMARRLDFCYSGEQGARMA